MKAARRFEKAVRNDRMERLGDGRVLVRLKQRWADGTIAKMFEPRDLLTKVVALMPGHGANLPRYHRQLAPAAQCRRLIGPRGIAEPPAAVSRAAAASSRSAAPPSTRLERAEQLKRSFAVDVLQSACGGRRRLVAVIEQPEVVCKILSHLGVPTAAPEFAAARGPPLLALAAAGLGHEWRAELDAEFVEPEL